MADHNAGAFVAQTREPSARRRVEGIISRGHIIATNEAEIADIQFSVEIVQREFMFDALARLILHVVHSAVAFDLIDITGHKLTVKLPGAIFR